MTQQAKVWAMYDGQNRPADITKGKWYEVMEVADGFYLIDDSGYKIYACWFRSTHINGDNWQRHVGPTPPNAQEAALQQLADMGQAIDAAPRFAVSVVKEDLPKEYTGANDKAAPDAAMQELADPKHKAIIDAFQEAISWRDHDGSAKRPKGVGKRDEVVYYLSDGCIVNEWGGTRDDWSLVTRYRITKRAEKRRKVWVVESSDKHGLWYRDKAAAKKYAAAIGSNVIPAKLTEVTE